MSHTMVIIHIRKTYWWIEKCAEPMAKTEFNRIFGGNFRQTHSIATKFEMHFQFFGSIMSNGHRQMMVMTMMHR